MMVVTVLKFTLTELLNLEDELYCVYFFCKFGQTYDYEHC